jgi:hypothetical protein
MTFNDVHYLNQANNRTTDEIIGFRERYPARHLRIGIQISRRVNGDRPAESRCPTSIFDVFVGVNDGPCPRLSTTKSFHAALNSLCSR